MLARLSLSKVVEHSLKHANILSRNRVLQAQTIIFLYCQIFEKKYIAEKELKSNILF